MRVEELYERRQRRALTIAEAAEMLEGLGWGHCLTLHWASGVAELPAPAVSRNPSGRSRHEGSSAGHCRER